jgi:hypothetical protein
LVTDARVVQIGAIVGDAVSKELTALLVSEMENKYSGTLLQLTTNESKAPIPIPTEAVLYPANPMRCAM